MVSKKVIKRSKLRRWIRKQGLKLFHGVPEEEQVLHTHIRAPYHTEELCKTFSFNPYEYEADEDILMDWMKEEAEKEIGKLLMEKGYIAFGKRRADDPYRPDLFHYEARFKFGLLPEHFRDTWGTHEKHPL